MKHNDIGTKEQLKTTANAYLQDIVEYLSDEEFLVDHLTENGKTKYMGYCRLTPEHKVRRIDIRFVACDCFYPAVLYFTGSCKFNQDMRRHALKKGYTLNEYGIYRVKSKVGRKIIKGDRMDVAIAVVN